MDVIERIHAHAFAQPLLEYDMDGWMDAEAFPRQFERAVAAAAQATERELLVVEVGSWKGLSACVMAGHLRERGLRGRVVAIDTWLGSPEHLATMARDSTGVPTLYRQFLSNVQHLGLQEWVYPFPVASTQGGHFLEQHGVLADVVYIDAGHETEAVALDAAVFWRVLRPGGTLIFDDYAWASVARAVDDFAAERGLAVVVDGSVAAVAKPVTEPRSPGVAQCCPAAPDSAN